MLLVRIKIGSTWHYISDVDQTAHVTGTTYRQYLAGIIAMDEIRIAPPNPWGGLARLEYGAVTLSPAVFSGSWPPPTQMDIEITYASAGESDEQLLLTGAAYLQEIRAESVIYALYSPSINTTVENRLFFGGMYLQAEEFCADLGLTLVDYSVNDLGVITSMSNNQIVEWEATGERLLIDCASDLMAWTRHLGYIESGNLVMVHIGYSNGPTMALQASDILSTGYIHQTPYKSYECEGEEQRPTIWRILPTRLQDMTHTACAWAEIDVKWVYDANWHGPSALNCADATPLYPLTNLVDNVAATYWAAEYPIGDTGQPQHLIFNTGGYYITGYRLQARNDAFYSQAPIEWELEAWDRIYNIWRKVMDVEASQWSAGSWQEFSVPTIRPNAVVTGSYPYGDACVVSPSCNWDHAAKLSSLTSIKVHMDKVVARVQVPLEPGKIPKIGQRVTYTDTSLQSSTAVEMKVIGITYSFDTHSCVIEGAATLT